MSSNSDECQAVKKLRTEQGSFKRGVDGASDSNLAAGTAALISWITTHGGIVDGVRVEVGGAAGCRLVADKDLPAGYTIYQVPLACVLSAEACTEMPHGKRMKELFELVVPEELDASKLECGADSKLDMVTKRSALYTSLMVAPAEHDTPFGPYLAELRTCAAPTPFTWAANGGIESLDASWADIPDSIADEWRDYWDTLHLEYGTLFPKLCDVCPDIFPADLCSEASWLRAHSLYTSRAFPLQPELSKPDGVLLPLLDRLNHDFVSANVEWRGVGLEKDRGARTTRVVLAGEELLYSYGCKANADLTLGYGFAVWGNPHEEARVTVDLAELFSAVALDPEKYPRIFAAADPFDALIGKLEDDKFCCQREDSKAVFKLILEDEEASLRPAGAWLTLCQICEAVSVLTMKSRASSKSLGQILSIVLKQACDDLKCGSDVCAASTDWDAHVRSVRARDSLQVGASCCATTVEGITMAMKDTQLSILTAALTAARDVLSLPAKKKKVRVGGRGRKRVTHENAAGGVAAEAEAADVDCERSDC